MPEIHECFMYYLHAHHVLVESLELGRKPGNWKLQVLWADATKSESGEGGNTRASGLSILHSKGYMDTINHKCKLARGQKSHQTKVWPVDLESGCPVTSLESLTLQEIGRASCRERVFNWV